MNKNKSKKFYFSGFDCTKPVVLTYNFFRPEKGEFIVKLKIKNQTVVIAQIHPELQKSFSYLGEDFCYDQDTLQLFLFVDQIIVEVEASEEDQLDRIQNVSIALEDHLFSHLPDRVFDTGVRYAQYLVDPQIGHRLCLPCSMAHALALLGLQKISPLVFAQACYDFESQIFGNWSLASFAVYELSQGLLTLQITTLNLDLLKQLLKFRAPVCVSVKGEIEGAIRPFLSGHLLMVLEIDDNTVTVLDSAAFESDAVKKQYPIELFRLAWEKRDYRAFIFQKNQR